MVKLKLQRWELHQQSLLLLIATCCLFRTISSKVSFWNYNYDLNPEYLASSKSLLLLVNCKYSKRISVVSIVLISWCHLAKSCISMTLGGCVSFKLPSLYVWVYKQPSHHKYSQDMIPVHYDISRLHQRYSEKNICP